MRHNETFYTMLVLAAALLWGTTGTAQSFAPSGASPLSIGAVRLAVGGTALLVFALWKGALGDKVIWRKWSTFLAAGCISAYQLFFFAGVLKTGVAVGTMVAIGSAPVFAGIISLIFRRENPGLKWAAATLLSIVGCVLLAADGQRLEVNSVGVLLALGAGASYALYAATSKKLLDSHPPEAVTGAVFFIGALFLSPLLFILDLDWLKSMQGICVAMHLGLMATALAYVLFSHGLAKIPFPKAVTLSLAEPLTAAALGVFLLKEQLSLVSQIGMFLVFSGLVILSLAGLRKKG
ncbi:putative transporter YwfM (plasmid) [Peptoclostridium acidaminophilum DSM 3953]|uniref:Putative transporter YwfM n=1 Tax=Peptoclostridium acidaminophilum DSM 3953 TaxID=1286171 RepID=W8TNN2_PEPAC|nr:EamA family transporter [Peptoclostridium acidaminophilum]AHM57772.1 putative transporter YwfM [Peptoclostridium acidaminophilum DSM 3953]